MGVIVQFNLAAFRARYPEFANVADATVTGYSAEAQIYHRNDGGGPINNPAVQSVLINMVTAFIAQRYSDQANLANPASPSTPVGRVSDASEGSVSASLDMGGKTPDAAAFWLQNKYGADYWEATKVFRTGRYVPGRCKPALPFTQYPYGGY